MTLSWDRKKKTKHTDRLNTHITDFVEFEEFQLPEENEPCAKDPRVYPTGEMWRDTVRRQLRFEALRLDLVTMRLCSPDPSRELQTLLVYGHGSPAPWDEVNALLCRSNLEATFTYTLRALEEDEELELEHQGPPLALIQDIRLGADNDVELQPQAAPGRRSMSVASVPQTDQIGQPQGETRGIDDLANRRIST